MLDSIDPLDEGAIIRAKRSNGPRIPIFSSLIQAGFPSPAESHIERVVSLDDLCITNPEATYFVRVTGDSMINDRIAPGDVLIVDCSRPAADGKIVVVWVNGEHTVKRIKYAGEMVVLMPANPNYTPIYIHEGDDFRVFGVVTYVINKPV